ncbi:Dam family site-specific DNA-(adenine-N6)-methyltransferase [bacterium]|nr:Dam family site-specific DNA-(adenine-N6)-methyltransferase [bacterium]
MFFNDKISGTILRQKKLESDPLWGNSPNTPFFPWVGGKRKLLNQIHLRLPQRFNNYIEPFVGGGAVFFSLAPEKAVINDFNPEVTNAYRVVRDYPDELIEELGWLTHSEMTFNTLKHMDRDKSLLNRQSPVVRAARFIYLLKASFSSKWDVNAKDEFINVSDKAIPEGRIFVDDKYEKVIYNCNRHLQGAHILTGDFMGVKPYIKKGDFVYIDPPYAETWVGYTGQGFDSGMQERVKELCDYIDSIGAYFMVSNSNVKFIHELYQRFNVNVVEFHRGLQTNKKEKVSEVLVTNY